MKEEIEKWLNSSDSKEYFELLRMSSVGSDPAHLKDCVATATWLKRWLAQIGADAELLLPRGPVEGSPAPTVFAVLKGDPDAMTVLVYGHYDVQPPDPLGEWASPPFEPTVRDGRIYARGAQDDKGQLFSFLCGLRRLWMREGAFAAGRRPTVKFVLEGREESGSAALCALLEERDFRTRLAADVLLVSDTDAAPGLRPAIVAGLRGIFQFTLTLTGAARDLHSGQYGGVAPNAAQGMAELLASLHHPDGSIAVAGFRDGILPPSHEELTAAEAGLDGEAGYAAEIGTDPCGGQLGKTIAQRLCFEPTIEVNGVHSGYGGPGSKTVIPSKAVAKISARLVPGQNPQTAFEAVKRHLKDHCPKGMLVTFDEVGGLASGFRLPLASPVFRLAEDVLGAFDPRGAAFVWDGASIPVLSTLADASGAAPLIVGWGQAEDRIHAPNESYSVEQFNRCSAWAEKILSALTQP